MLKEEATKLLKKWNNGIYRGAQRRLARELGVEESAISDCLSGRQNPSEKMIVKMAKILNQPEEEIKRIFYTPREEMSYVQNNIKRRGIILRLSAAQNAAHIYKDHVRGGVGN